MNLRIFVYILVYILLNVFSGYPMFSGNLKKVFFVDASTGNPLPFVMMKSGTEVYMADERGVCLVKIQRENREKVFKVQLLGYKSHKISMGEILDMPALEVRLQQDKILLDEVVVTARKISLHKGMIMQKISDRLQENVGGTLMDVLARARGVSFISNGITVAKPVIQGLYGNRILLVNNGVSHRGQQWGDEHSPEIDWNSARSVTIIKGAQTIKYGPDALGGVLLFEPGALRYGEHRLHGHASCAYGTDGRRYALNAGTEGTLPFLTQMAWRLRCSYLNSGDRSCPKYLLNNTGTRNMGFQTEWGYRRKGLTAELGYSFFKSDEGILYIAQRGDAELFKERVEIGRPVEVAPFSRKIDYPYHKVVHHTLNLKTEFSVAGGKATLHCDWQKDNREEFQQRRNNLSYLPSLGIGLTHSRAKLDWERRYAGVWCTETGGEISFTDNTNVSGTGVVPVIPNYTEQRWGMFFIQKMEREKWGLEAGIRFDHVTNLADGYDVYGMRYGEKKHFSGLSVSTAGYWRFREGLKCVLNWGMAWRPPHVRELYSKGVEHALGVYLVGDSGMRTENVHKLAIACEYVWKGLSLTVEGFLHRFGRYIYDEPTGEFITMVSGTYPVFRYRQVDTFFRGVDASCSLRLANWMEYAVSGGMIWANEIGNGRYLPYIPPFRLTESLNFSHKWGNVELKHRYVGKQNRFDPQTDLVSFSPPAYHWLGVSAGVKIRATEEYTLRIRCEVTNLLNTEYREYTNRFRYYAHEAGRDVKWAVIWDF